MSVLGKELKTRNVEVKLRKFCREGKISLNDMTSHEITQNLTRRTREGTVTHHTLENPDIYIDYKR